MNYEIPTLERTFNGRDSMRSIADAIDRLRKEGQLCGDARAQIRTGPIRLPTGEIVSIILVIAQSGSNTPSSGVALPSSRSFRGHTIAGQMEEFDISRLDCAWANQDGIVELSDGTRLRAVNVIPETICYELTPLQKRIVYRTLAMIPSNTRRYRGPATIDLRFLDYSKLYGLKLPSLKAIQRRLYEKDPKLRRVTRQTIANALSACGMRRPRSGRLAAKNDAATVSPESD
jgi:hypothetical protein